MHICPEEYQNIALLFQIRSIPKSYKFARLVVTIISKSLQSTEELCQYHATLKHPMLSFKPTNLSELHSSLQALIQQPCFSSKKREDAQIIDSTSSAPRLVPWLPSSPFPCPIKYRALDRVVSVSG